MRYLTVAGRQISVVGLGAWQFGSRGWGWGEGFGTAEANDIVQRALDLGVNVFDTAEIYSSGVSESVLGAALEGRRSEAYVATKIWPFHPLRRQVVPAARRSLRRLGVDSVELYQIHWPNPLVPLSWTMAGMRDARDAGMIEQVGVSNFGLERWRRADAALGSPVVSNQVVYNLLQPKAERELVPFAQREGRMILAYSPLAQGLLSGRYDVSNLPGGFRRTNALFIPTNLRLVRPVLDVLQEVAEAHRVVPAQIALAWCLRLPQVAVIPGSKSVWQLEQNVEAADIELSPDQVAALDEVSAAFRPVGRVRGFRELARRLASR